MTPVALIKFIDAGGSVAIITQQVGSIDPRILAALRRRGGKVFFEGLGKVKEL